MPKTPDAKETEMSLSPKYIMDVLVAGSALGMMAGRETIQGDNECERTVHDWHANGTALRANGQLAADIGHVVADDALLSAKTVYTLPAASYTDAILYAVERDRIFARTWQLIGRLDDLAQPGNYIATDIAGYPICAIRDAKGELKAFHNVCRHRGAMLLAKGQGTIPSKGKGLLCPYHGWTYRLDGCLNEARDFGEAPDFDPINFSLLPVRIEAWQSLVFVNLDLAAPPLVTAFDAITEIIAPYRLEAVSYYQTVTFNLQCNWKVFTDNYLEGYHIPLIHPELNRDVKANAYQVLNVRGFSVHQAPLRDGAKVAGLWLWQFPNLALNLYEDGMNVLVIQPCGLDKTQLRFQYFFRDIPMAQKETTLAYAMRVAQEDIPVCESVQKNLEAGIFQKGPLSPRHESGVLYFHNLWKNALQPVLRQESAPRTPDHALEHLPHITV